MENSFSLNNMSLSMFGPNVSNDSFKGFGRTTPAKSISSGVIKQAIAISDNRVKSGDNEYDSDSLYRIKETEKILSKKILFAIYSYKIHSKSGILDMDPKYDSIWSFDYTNLRCNDVPNMSKAKMLLTQIDTMINNYKGSVGVSDKAAQYYSALKIVCDDIRNKDVVQDLTDSMIKDTDNFVMDACKYFRGETDFKKIFINSKEKYEKRIQEIDSSMNDIVNSVATYNSNIVEVIGWFTKIRKKLIEEYKAVDEQQTRQIKFKKHELLIELTKYITKYLAYANILYSLKTDAIVEFMNTRESSPHADITSYIKNESFELDESELDIDFTLEHSELDYIDSYKKTYWADSIFALEAQFADLCITDIINEAENDNVDKDSSKSIWEHIKAIFNKIIEAIKSFFTKAKEKVETIKKDKALIGKMSANLEDTDNAFSIMVPTVNMDNALSRGNNFSPKEFKYFYENYIVNKNMGVTEAINELYKEMIPDLNNLDNVDDNKNSQYRVAYLKNYFAGNRDLKKVAECLKSKDKKSGNDSLNNNNFLQTELTGSGIKNMTITKMMEQVDAMTDLRAQANFHSKLLNKINNANIYSEQQTNKLKQSAGANNASGSAQEAAVNIQSILNEYFNDIDMTGAVNEADDNNNQANQNQQSNTNQNNNTNNNNQSNNNASNTQQNNNQNNNKPDNTANKNNSNTNNNSQQNQNNNKEENKPNQDNSDVDKKIKTLNSACSEYGKCLNTIVSAQADACKEIYNVYLNQILIPLQSGPLGKKQEENNNNEQNSNNNNNSNQQQQQPEENQAQK